jgi:hypothetical protein
MIDSPRHGLVLVTSLLASSSCGDAAENPDALVIQWIDARTDPCGPDPLVCNLLTQTGCVAGDKCTWIRGSEECGDHVGCAPAGPVAVGGSCTWGADGATTGYDDCAQGAICSAEPDASTGTCERMCSPWDATLPCPSGSACAVRAGLFSDEPNETLLAGICEPTCNPLVQTRDSDGAPACGSPDPAHPTLGCFATFTSGPAVFTCGPAGTLGHRDPGPGSGCLPGTNPYIRESGTPEVIVCLAFCAPLTVNNTQPPEARDGAEPYSCPEMPRGTGVVGPVARADGADERCQHLWVWEGAAPPSPAGNAYGICMDPTRFTWDDDRMPATPPVPWPMPETLDPYVDAMNPQPNEDLFWGYAPRP